MCIYCIISCSKNPILFTSDGMRYCRSNWPGLYLFCCYQPSCCQPTGLILGLFLFHKSSLFTGVVGCGAAEATGPGLCSQPTELTLGFFFCCFINPPIFTTPAGEISRKVQWVDVTDEPKQRMNWRDLDDPEAVVGGGVAYNIVCWGGTQKAVHRVVRQMIGWINIIL